MEDKVLTGPPRKDNSIVFQEIRMGWIRKDLGYHLARHRWYYRSNTNWNWVIIGTRWLTTQTRWRIVD